MSPSPEFATPRNNLKPESLRLDPDRPYAFKSPWKTLLVRWIDALGAIFYQKPAPSIDWSSVKKVAVLRLDQLGDVLLALPALEVLSQALPHAQVDFFVDSGAREMVEIANLKINVRVFHAPWLAKSKTRLGSWKAVRELLSLLRIGRYDAVIDLRGDFRHIFAMKYSAIPIRIGRTLTGGGFWLTHPIVRQPGLHEVEQNLDLLEKSGIEIPTERKFPRLFPREQDHQKQLSIRNSLQLTRSIVAIHATCAATAKRWTVSSWHQLIEKLPEDMDVVILGSENEKADMEEIVKDCKRKVTVAAGLLRLPELAAFLKQCKLFIGVDSGPAHIAVAVETPVVSIFSGTNSATQWVPRGLQVSFIQKPPLCSPCDRVECPLNNECMVRIEVENVLSAVNALLLN